MPDAKSPTDAPPPTASVCTCGYDLAGLPPDATAKCPECGTVIAEIEPPRLRFVLWGPFLVAGMTPVLTCFLVAAIDFLDPSLLWDYRVGAIMLAVAGVSWVLVSIPAWSVLLIRAIGIRSRRVWCVLAAIATLASFVANVLVFSFMVLLFA